ncbi:MAG: hypothetical protein JSS11_15070 [Verrucomicrobia bacterium]|nr:hypothetical protein [Verrucomicrobiota bacterium]
MSLSASIFLAYFFIGLVLMIVGAAVRRNGKSFPDTTDGTHFGAALLILFALLWPIWVLVKFRKDRR